MDVLQAWVGDIFRNLGAVDIFLYRPFMTAGVALSLIGLGFCIKAVFTRALRQRGVLKNGDV